MAEYDHAVVGAGIVGTWTALQLLRLGKKVLLLDQFREPHTRGSSQGQSRIIRSSYVESFFAEMMPHAYCYWRDTERKTGKQLIETCGLLCIFKDPEEEQLYQSVLSNIQTYTPQYLDQDNETVKSLFNKSLHFKKKPHALLFDKSGGVLFAHKALLTVQELYRSEGGHLWDNCEVTNIVPSEEKVDILTSKGLVTVPSVVVCAGPWTQKLLVPNLIPSLPLQAVAVKVFYWKEKEPGAYSASSGFPVILDFKNPHVYAIPSLEYPGLVKASIHGGSPCNPDERDLAPRNTKLEEVARNYLSEHLPLLEKEPSIIETCMYTVTPDENFIIDHVPGHKNVLFGAGFSGTGFKTAPVVGRMLSEMATGTKPFLDITPFRLSRFS